MPDLASLLRTGQPDNSKSVPKSSDSGPRRPSDAEKVASESLYSAGWLARALGRADPLLQFDWDVALHVGGLFHKPEYVETVNVPGIQTAADSVFRAGTKIYVAGAYEYGALSVRLYEDVNMTSTKFLRTWYGLIHKPNGDHGIPAEYKGLMEVYPTTPNGQPIAIIKCIGIFPTQHPPFQGGDSSERQALDVEFSCDSVEIQFLK